MTAEAAAVQHSRWRHRGLFVVKLGLATGLLAWLFATGRLDFSLLAKVCHYGYLGLAEGAVLAGTLLTVWRWKWLADIQDVPLPTWTALRLTWIGLFASMFLPGVVGGDAAKAYAACQYHPGAKTRALSTVFMDRVLGLHSILFLGCAAGMWILAQGCTAGEATVVWLAILCLGMASVGSFLLLCRHTSALALRLLPRRFRSALADSLAAYARSWRSLLAIWLFSGLCNALAITSYLLVAAAFDVGVSLAQVLAVPLVALANSLPISPGGLGVGEMAGSHLFSQFGLAQGGLVILVVRLSIMVFSIPGALALFGSALPKRTMSRAEA
jgi:uncharacterized protein (TIRG00374 family)